MILGIFPASTNFFAKPYIGGTPTPPPINITEVGIQVRLYPLPKGQRISNSIPASISLSAFVPLPTTL